MPEVDERVATLVFDNSEFDPEVKKSQKTLEEFEKSLDPKAFDKYAKDLNSQDFKPLNNSLSALGNTFKSIETIATGALLNIGMKMENFISSGIKSLTLDQATAGWGKYGSKVGSVQTIMAATSKQFKDTDIQMQYVSNQLETLNRFTDETSYSFVDMVNNIGKFTSKGIQLDTAVAAMEGISTWAALSGQGTESAAHAMYNLSQAIGQGYLKLIDWKSIQIANMDTVEFKETAIETAKALGTLKDAGDGVLKTAKGNIVSVKNFEQNLSDAWLTSEVLMKSLEKYGGFAQKLIESLDKTGLTAEQTLDAIDDYRSGTKSLDDILKSTSGDAEELRKVIEELGTEEYDLGRRAFRASYEAKTLAEAINYVKDAVSTGWTTSFEYIFGNYQEAKEFWTWFSNILYEIFVVSGETRNEILKIWHDSGGRAEMIEGLKALRDIFFELKDVARTVLGEIFPRFKDTNSTIENTARFLLTITRLFKNFVVNLKENEELVENIRSGIRLLGTALRFALKILEGIYIFFQPTIRWTKELFSTLSKLIKPLNEEATSALEFAEGLNAIRMAFLILGAVIAAPIKLIQGLVNWFTSLGNKTLPELWNDIKTWASNTWGAIKSLFTNIAILGKNVFEGFKNGLTSGFTALGKLVEGLFKGLIELVKTILGIHSPSIVFASIGAMIIAGLIVGIMSMSDKLRDALQKTLDMIKSFAVGIALAVTLIIIGIAISKLINSISKFSAALPNLFESISTFFKQAGTALNTYAEQKFKGEIIRSIGQTVLMISAAIAILALVFIALSKIPLENIKTAAIVMSAIAGVLLVFTIVLAIMQKVFNTGSMEQNFQFGGKLGKILNGGGKGFSKTTNTMATGLATIAGAILSIALTMTELMMTLIVVSGLMKLWKIEPEQMWQMLGFMSALIAVVLGFAVGFSAIANSKKISIDFKTAKKLMSVLIGFGATFMLFSKVLVSMAKSIAKINKMPDVSWLQIMQTMLGIIAIIGILGLLAGMMSKVPQMGAGIGYLAAIIGILTGAILTISLSMLLMEPAMKSMTSGIDIFLSFLDRFSSVSDKAFEGVAKFIAFSALLLIASILLTTAVVSFGLAMSVVALAMSAISIALFMGGLGFMMAAGSFALAALSLKFAANVLVNSFDLFKNAKEKLTELFSPDFLTTIYIITQFAFALMTLGISGLVGSLGIITIIGAFVLMSVALEHINKVMQFFTTISWEMVAGMAKLALGLFALGLAIMIVAPGIATLALSILAVAGGVYILSAAFVLLGNNAEDVKAIIIALTEVVDKIALAMVTFSGGVLAVGAAFIVAGLGAIIMGLGLTVVAAATLALVVNALLAVGVLFLFDLLLNKIKEDNPELYDTIINVVSAIGQVIAVTANLIKLLSPLFEAVIPIAIEVITTTYKIIKTVIMAVFNFFKAKWEELKNFWNTYIQPAVDVITGFIDKIYQGIKNKVDKFTQAGKDIIAGLIDGMTNNKTVYGLFKALTGISDDMIAEFRKSIDAHSPSLLYAEAGEDMMEGVEQGAQERASSVYSQRAMQNSAKAQYEAYDKEIDSLLSNIPNKFKKMGEAISERETQAYTANGKQNLEDIEKRETTERDKTLGGALGNIWDDVKKIFKQVKEGDITLGDGLKALLESLKTHGGTFLGDKLDSLKNLIFGEGGPLSGFSDLLKNPFGNFEDIFKSLNLEEITKGIGDIDLGGASDNVPDMSGLGGAGVGAGQGRQEQFVFTQNNYSPKALSRLEIYRQTKRQFNEFRVREELAK